ncbi:MAG: hypothetical protein JWO07_169 [Candidatus Saccharibacteria bacterium]|nr:hypothetical protein [Candidatus Saccharibacteria bacterium]
MVWFWVAAAIFLLFGFVVFRGAPYVPSHRKYARLALTKLYRLNADDVLVDLGSGDGTILRMASLKGARAIGYELNPILVLISQLLARGDKKQTTILADMWLTDFPADTTIVYVFSVTRDEAKLLKKLQNHVDEHGSDLWCITYGAGLRDKQPVKKLHAHTLYLFEPNPLQRKQA